MLSPRTRLVACSLVVAVTMSIVPAARAQAGLTLTDALAHALRDSPELRVYPYQRRAAEAEKLQAGLRPNPELNVTLENFGGTGEVRGTRSLETTLALSQLIELGRKRDHRIGIADAGLGGTQVDYNIARLDVLAETTRRFIDVAQAQVEVDQAQSAIALVQKTRESVERRIQAGAASTAERNRVAIVELRAQLDLSRAQGELASKRLALAAMWGSTSADGSAVLGELAALPDLLDFEVLATKLDGSPDLRRFMAERRLREAEVRLAQAQAVPDLTIGAGVRRLESGNSGTAGASADYGLVASLNLPLPMGNRNQGAIAAAQARVEQSDAERGLALLRARSVLFGLYQSATQARREARALGGDALAQAEQALSLTQRGFANGRFSLLELIDAQRQVLELRQQTSAAQADAHRLDAEIERLTGEPIVAPLPPAESTGESR